MLMPRVAGARFCLLPWLSLVLLGDRPMLRPMLHHSPRNSLCRSRGVVFAVIVGFLVLFALSGCGVSAPAKDKENAPKASVRYELVNVTIPPDSPYRKNLNLNQPPRLFVIVKRNGVPLGSASTTAQGWSADFVRDESKNQWEVSEGTDDRYTVEVWDWNLIWKNIMIFNLTGLKGEDFGRKMYEPGTALVDKDRLATIEWRKIEKPTAGTKQ